MKYVVSNRKSACGFTLIELVVATTILVILTSLAIPMARVTIKREKERELRNDLWEMRDAIDRYKDAADRGAFQIKVVWKAIPRTWILWSKAWTWEARKCVSCAASRWTP